MVVKQSTGNERNDGNRRGNSSRSDDFLKAEYRILSVFVIIVTGVLAFAFGANTAIAFVAGAFASALAGFIGMKAATKGNVRTAAAAKDKGVGAALMVAFNGGAVMGLSVASLGLIGLGSLFYLYVQGQDIAAVSIISGFSMGASSIALFARIGGGIFTKAADVGSDLVGKVEAGIPEDDPRNPGVIADNVGDNVGDVAGMGADIFESYVGSMIATIAIGAGMAAMKFEYMALPIIVAMVGLIASIIGIRAMDTLENMDPAAALRNCTFVSAGAMLFVAFFIIKVMGLPSGVFVALAFGCFAGIGIGLITEYYTAGSPVVKIAESSKTGVATVMITGLAVALESCAIPVIIMAVAIYFGSVFAGLYGVGLGCSWHAGDGRHHHVGRRLRPIADNAAVFPKWPDWDEDTRKITDGLDAVGNTTAASREKDFAIGSAALTALALFSAYTQAAGIESIDITSAKVVVGLLIGGVIPFFVASLTMNSVGVAAFQMVEEIRRQFREIPGLMEGTGKPDSARCIDISTQAALREMILPGVVAIIMPIFIGLLLGAEALGGMLMGATLSGVLLALFMSNGGGAWDNAKKAIEQGEIKGAEKGDDAHSAAVVGDTIGDPFKDTSGPSLNILIKLMSIVSVVIAGMLGSGWLNGLF